MAHTISDKISCTETYIHVDKWYTLHVYLGPWTRPDTYICSASAQMVELNAVGVLEVLTLSGAGVSLYTGSSVRDGLVVVWGVSVDTTI